MTNVISMLFSCRWFAFQKRLCLIIDTYIYFSAMFSQNTSFELDTMLNYIKSMWIKAKARKWDYHWTEKKRTRHFEATNDKRKSQLHTNITFDLFISIAVMSDYRSFFSCPHSHFNSFHHFWCGQLQNVFFCLLAGRTKCRILIEMSPDRSHTSTQLSPKMNRNLHF